MIGVFSGSFDVFMCLLCTLLVLPCDPGSRLFLLVGPVRERELLGPKGRKGFIVKNIQQQQQQQTELLGQTSSKKK